VNHRSSPEQLRNMGEIQTQFSLLQELDRDCKVFMLEILEGISSPMSEEVTHCSTILVLL